VERKIYGGVDSIVVLIGAKMLSDGELVGGWPAIICGLALLIHVAFSEKL